VTVLLLILIAPAVHAAYGVVVTPIDVDILRNESATYEVSISNFDASPADFQIFTIDPNWNVKLEPLNLVVMPESQKSVKLSLRPSSTANPGTQGVNVNFRNLDTGEVQRKTLLLTMRQYGVPDKEYAPTVALDILVPYDIDPREPVPLRLQVRNRNPLNITNLTILVGATHFETTSSMTLAPLSERTKDITGIMLDPRTSPGEGELRVQLIYNGEVVNQLARNYRIKEYTEIREQVTQDAFFFKTAKTITIMNNGNIQNTAVVTVPTSLVKSLFVSSSLPYENEVRDGQRVLLWRIPLGAEETREFGYTENYRILVLLVLLALLGVVLYIMLRSPVVALKEAVAIAHTEGVSDIKVRVFVKNRSAKLIQGIQVTDRVPSLAEVLKTQSPGSIAPTKIAVSDKQGTLLRWDLEVLEPFEERILTYQVKSKLKIIGRMKLPNARIRYTVGGKERAVYSNNIELVEKFKDR
jgi:hypothetical protein